MYVRGRAGARPCLACPSSCATRLRSVAYVCARVQAVTGVLLCAGERGLTHTAPDLAGAACHLAGMDAAFPVAVLTSTASADEPGLHLRLAATNPFLPSSPAGSGDGSAAIAYVSVHSHERRGTGSHPTRAFVDLVRAQSRTGGVVNAHGDRAVRRGAPTRRRVRPDGAPWARLEPAPAHGLPRTLRLSDHCGTRTRQLTVFTSPLTARAVLPYAQVRTLMSLQSTLGTWDAAEVYACTSAARMIQVRTVERALSGAVN